MSILAQSRRNARIVLTIALGTCSLLAMIGGANAAETELSSPVACINEARSEYQDRIAECRASGSTESGAACVRQAREEAREYRAECRSLPRSTWGY